TEGAHTTQVVTKSAKRVNISHRRFHHKNHKEINRVSIYKESMETRTPIMAESRERIAANLAVVEDRLNAACRRAGRAQSEVTLVAVTKTVSPEVAALLPELGIHDLGESRPQELWRKAAVVPGVRWHLIGHLQRNKIERTLPLVERIHSVD